MRAFGVAKVRCKTENYAPTFATGQPPALCRFSVRLLLGAPQGNLVLGEFVTILFFPLAPTAP